jgi:signal transduction histidine kinase
MAAAVARFLRLSRYGLPAAAVVVVLVMTFALTQFLEEREHILIRHLTASVASAVQADLEGDLEVRVLAPLRHAELWDLPASTPARTWRERAGAFLKAHPIFRAVGWAAPGGARRTLPADATLLADVPLDLGRQPAVPSSRELHGVREPVLLPAWQRPDGARLRPVVVPVFRGGELLGVGLAQFAESEGLDGLLQDVRGRGYAVAIEEEGGLAHGEPWTGQLGPAAWAQEVRLRVAGLAWRVRVWPTVAVLEELQSRLPEIVLVLGLALALFVGLTLHFQVRLHQQAVQLAAANDRLSDLSGRLVRLQDDERRHVARELHEGTAQMLVALGMNLGLARRAAASPGQRKVRGVIEDGLELVRQGTTEVQALAYRLHPILLDDLGLAVALPAYAEEFGRQSGLQIAVRVPAALDRLDRELELAIFRIAQEALLNVLRHSGSKTAEVALEQGGSSVTLQVLDAGRGIPSDVLRRMTSGPSVPGMGIAGMQERVRQLGGSLEIESLGQGTRLVARLPVRHLATEPEG